MKKFFLILCAPLLLGMSNNLSNQNVGMIAAATPAGGGTATWYYAFNPAAATGNAAIYSTLLLASGNGPGSLTLGQNGNVTKFRVSVVSVGFSAAVKLTLYDAANNALVTASGTITTGDAGTDVDITCSTTAVTAGTGYHVEIGTLTDDNIYMKAATGQPVGTSGYNTGRTYSGMPYSTYSGYSDHPNGYPIGVYVQ